MMILSLQKIKIGVGALQFKHFCHSFANFDVVGDGTSINSVS